MLSTIKKLFMIVLLLITALSVSFAYDCPGDECNEVVELFEDEVYCNEDPNCAGWEGTYRHFICMEDCFDDLDCEPSGVWTDYKVVVWQGQFAIGGTCSATECCDDCVMDPPPLSVTSETYEICECTD